MSKINPNPSVTQRKQPAQILELEHLETRVTQLYNQLEQLVTTQLELAKTEISEKIQQAKRGVGTVTVGGTLAFYGGQALLFGVVLLVNLWIESLWISALAVGAVVAVIGFIMITSGKKALDPSHLKPEKTMRSIQEDVGTIKRRTR